MTDALHKTHWPRATLNDVCLKIQDGAHTSPREQFSVGGPGRYLYITSKNIRNNFIDLSNVSYVGQDFHDQIYPRCTPEVGDLLLTKDGANTGNVTINTISEPFSLLSSVALIKTQTDILLPEFLSYYLQSPQGLAQITGQMTGTAIKRIVLRDLKTANIPLPPKRVQEQIVANLDGAFEQIATAIDHTKASITSLSSLFYSALSSLLSGKGPLKRLTIADVAIVFDGPHATPKTVQEGPVFLGISALQNGQINLGETRHVTEADFARWTRRVIPQPNDFVFSYETRLGEAALIPAGLICCLGRRLGLARLDTTQVDPQYFLYLYRSSSFQEFLGTKTIRGATVDRISIKDFPSFPIMLPALSKQQEIVGQLDVLRVEVERMIELRKQKLEALMELKQSLLHHAFSGQLIKQPSQAVVIRFPVTVPNISSTDLHIGVLAVAYAAHESARKASDFGHVKAEKIAHMVEAYVGVDLGRAPVRDAAGPNDFPHLKKVEHRADKAGYLTFARQPSGAYRVTKKAGFDSLVTKTRTAIGDRNQDLDKLLNLMTPMTTKQAEIFATVYAAWNNLLMDGEPITDERIVHAAREDWHSDKLNIPRDKFFMAIEWIKTKGLCPEGKGKRVEAKKH
jgi:type I restriction enzyme S subunit